MIVGCPGGLIDGARGVGMRESKFKQLVTEYDHRARHAPGRFTAVTAIWAVLGQLAILALLLLAMVGLAFAVGHLLNPPFQFSALLWALGFASLLWSTLAALWLRQQPLPGRVLKRGDAPKLFELIDKVHKRCQVPSPDLVVLDTELNAAILQQPRLGLLGWHRNVLVLGLPLLMTLDVKQLAAVVAHECGHLRGSHGKLGAWIYRTRRSWFRLAESRADAGGGVWLGDAALQLFFEYFFPRFNARAFVLSRQQEVEADVLARVAMGAKPVAEGLLIMAVQQRYLDEVFWPRMLRPAHTEPVPTGRPFRDMRLQMREAFVHPKAEHWLRDALRRVPAPGDTHPSLRERIQATETAPLLPARPLHCAADALCAKVLPKWLHWADEQWRKDVEITWATRYRLARRDAALLQDLAQEELQGPGLAPADLLLWARTAWRLDGRWSARQPLEQLLRQHPHDGESRYLMACLELDEASDPTSLQSRTAMRESGLARLEGLAQQGQSEWAVAAARRLEEAYEAGEDFAALADLRSVRKALEARDQQALEALYEFGGRVELSVPAFSARVLRPILDVLRREPAVGRAFFLKRTVSHAAGWSLYLLVIERKPGGAQPDAQHWWQALDEQIDMPLRLMVVDLEHPHWASPARQPLVEHIKRIEGACIYSGRSL